MRREGERWRLYIGAADRPSARVTINQGIAWRLFTKGPSSADTEQHATIEGDHQLGKQVLQTVSVIA
jgi:hypothetical protein